jgi:hypothetical protein
MASNNCIISVGVGGWYPKGIRRLRNSLKAVGYNGDTLFWEGVLPPGARPHDEDPYGFKIHAFNFAIQKGYTKILWLDASVYAIKNPSKFFDYISEKGYYTFKTGYNVAQSCSDAALKLAGVARDEAEEMTEAASGCIGVDMSNETANASIGIWEAYHESGMFNGSRQHDNQSDDPRFLFHRQDQSAWSIAVNKLGMNINDSGDYIAYKAHDQYYTTEINNTTLTFLIEGM